MKKLLDRLSNQTVYGVRNEGGLDLDKDYVPGTTVANCLKSIDVKPITYENNLPLRYWALLSEIHVNNVEDIVVTRDTANLWMSRKEVIQVISELGQAK